MTPSFTKTFKQCPVLTCVIRHFKGILNISGRVDGTCVCDHCNLLFCAETCKETYETSLQENTGGGTGVLHVTECAAFSQMEKKFHVENFAPGTVAYEYGSITVLRLLSLR